MAVITRAREAGRRDADRPDLLGPPARCSGNSRRRRFHFSDFRFGAIDGARTVGATDAVGFAWRELRWWCRRRSSAASYRVIDNRSENLQHCQCFFREGQKREKFLAGSAPEVPGIPVHGRSKTMSAERANNSAPTPPPCPSCAQLMRLIRRTQRFGGLPVYSCGQAGITKKKTF